MSSSDGDGKNSRSSATTQKMVDGDWICSDPDCKNLNFARRTQCNRCSKERVTDAASRKKLGTEIGKAAAEKSRGLFSAEDWQCNKCANVNWARRHTCNMCNAPKFTDVEERTGYGGGYNDRGVVEYKERIDSDDEYDEFGRRKKKKDDRKSSTSSRSAERQSVSTKTERKSDGRKDDKVESDEDDDDDDDDDEEDGGDLSKYDLWGSDNENNSTEKSKDSEKRYKKHSTSGSRSSSSSSTSETSSSRSPSSDSLSDTLNSPKESKNSLESIANSDHRYRSRNSRSKRSPARHDRPAKSSINNRHRSPTRSRSRSRSSRRSKQTRSRTRTRSRSPPPNKLLYGDKFSR